MRAKGDRVVCNWLKTLEEYEKTWKMSWLIDVEGSLNCGQAKDIY
jgi:hypothetical protein